MPPYSLESSDTVRAAAAGDERAWEVLVTRYTPMLRAVARGFKLSNADVDDVVQATWLAAIRGLGAIKNADAVGAWLAVVARRESLRTLQTGVGEYLTACPPTTTEADDSTETIVLAQERCDALRAAVSNLPRRQRVLVAALLDAPYASYAELSRRLGMPVGSIGPTRERALARLANDPALGGALRAS